MFEDVCYQKSFLKQVIVKVDFATPIEQIRSSVPNKLFNAIVSYFPIVEPTEVSSHLVSFQGDSVQSQQTTLKQWNYFSKDRGAQLAISAESIFALYTSYKTFEETKEQFSEIITALSKAFPETKASRFGLRYINEIELPGGDPINWSEYIDSKLLIGSGFFDEQDKLTRLIGISEIQYEDINLRFQFGIPNPDYPAPIKRPLFILDMDASITQAHDLAEDLDYMDMAHDRIQALFEKSITSELRGKMHARPIQ